MAVGPGNLAFARKLASSNRNTREKGISLLVRWLPCQVDVGEEELKKIWKGLFYCVWQSDKAAVQVELIDSLAGLLEIVEVDVSVLFFKVFLSTMRREWGGIDKLRVDKFYLLLRKFLTHMFKVLDKGGWDNRLVTKFMAALEERAFLATDRFPALGINLHFLDIFWSEFQKFLPVPDGTLGLLLEPFFTLLARSSNKVLLRRVKESIFIPLLDDAKSLLSDFEKRPSLHGTTWSIGLMLRSASVGPRLFDLASSPSTAQFNRKVLYELNEQFSKLAKSLDSLEAKTASQLNGTLASLPNCIATEETGSFYESLLEGLHGGSRTRSQMRQSKGDPSGVLKAGAVGVSNFKNSEKWKVEQAPDKGVSQTSDQDLRRNREQYDVACKEETEGQDRIGKKKRNYEASLIPAKAGLPHLQKMFARRKAKKKKKSPAKMLNVESCGNGLVDLLEPETLRSDGVPRTNCRQYNRSQSVDVIPDCIIEGHQNVNELTVNLEEKFEIGTADELIQSLNIGNPVSGAPLGSPLEPRSRKKRRKEKGAFQSTSISSARLSGAETFPVSSPVRLSATDAGGDVKTPAESAKKAKKVRFVLRNNLICKPHAPLPPLSLRTPPSATPRGSALKSGVLPGPIRTRPIRIARGNGVVKSRNRASRQLLTLSMQKPKSSTRKLRIKPKL